MKKVKLEFDSLQLVSIYKSLLTAQSDLDNQIKDIFKQKESNEALMTQIVSYLPDHYKMSLPKKGSTISHREIEQSNSNISTPELELNISIENETSVSKSVPVVRVPKVENKNTNSGSNKRINFNWKGKIMEALTQERDSELLVAAIAEYIIKKYPDPNGGSFDIKEVAKTVSTYCYKMAIETKELAMRKLDGRSLYTLNPNHPDNKQYFNFPDEDEEIDEEIDEEEIDNNKTSDEEDEIEEEDDDEIEDDEEDEDNDFLDADDKKEKRTGEESPFQSKKVKYLKEREYDDIVDDPEYNLRLKELGYKKY